MAVFKVFKVKLKINGLFQGFQGHYIYIQGFQGFQGFQGPLDTLTYVQSFLTVQLNSKHYFTKKKRW